MNKAFTRRVVVIGVATVAAAGVAAVEGPKLLKPRHAPSPYDDLLDRLDDRDAAAQIGEAVLAGRTGFDAAKVAEKLRKKLRFRRLSRVNAEDAAAYRVVEANGWILPETLALLCALAAKTG
jgi:hypothetical protein